MRINLVALALLTQLSLGLSACQEDDNEESSEEAPAPQEQVVLPPPTVIPGAGGESLPVVTPPTVGTPVPPTPNPNPTSEATPVTQPLTQPITQPLTPSETPIVTEPALPVIAEPSSPVVPEATLPSIPQPPIPEPPLASTETEIPAITPPEVPVITQPEAPVIAQPEVPVITQPEVPEAPLTQPLPLPEEPVPEPALLAVFGDSISTGVLANTRLGQYMGTQAYEWLTKLFSGDVTSRLEAERALSYPALSAAASTAEFGLRQALAKSRGLDPQQVEVVNLAEFGALSTAMPMMLERLKTAEYNLARKADTVFVMLGSNDFCSENSVDDFRASYENGLAHILKEHPGATYILAPIPSIHQLSSIDYTYIPALPGTSGSVLSCNTLHRYACSRLDDADAGERVQAMNAVIFELAEKLKTSVGPEKVKTIPSIAAWEIQPEHLAFDCFHPSAAGQELLGRLIGDALVPR